MLAHGNILSWLQDFQLFQSVFFSLMLAVKKMILTKFLNFQMKNKEDGLQKEFF